MREHSNRVLLLTLLFAFVHLLPAGVEPATPDSGVVLKPMTDASGDALSPVAVAQFDTAGANGINAIAFSPDGDKLAVSGSKQIQIWETKGRTKLFEIGNSGGNTYNVAFSPDGKALTCGCHDGSVGIWNAATGEERLRLKGHEGVVRMAFYSPNGDSLASAGADRTVRLWKPDTGEERLKLTEEDDIWSIALSPDGVALAVANGKGWIRLIEVSTGKERIRFKVSTAAQLAYSRDGKTLASGEWGMGPCRLWDAIEGKEIRTLAERGSCSPCVAFSPDGSRVAASVGNNSVVVWDSSTGQRLFQLMTWYGGQRFAFSPDGKMLAARTMVSTVTLWDLSTVRNTEDALPFNPRPR